MADISTTNKKARVPILGENGRISDAYLPQAVIDAEASSKTYAENAKSYSELVKKDAESAASSAASAKASADTAREGISSIDEKVTQAGQFAEAASSSATEANSYLKQVTAFSGTVSGIASSVAENAQVAETFANESKENAASALTASTNAVNAKVDAEGYRDSAKSYSDDAKADADTAKNILESVKTQKADVDSTVQQFNTDAAEYDTKFNGYVSEARESKEASAASATSASESAENASTSATTASISADKAKTSADAAALSATNAANSANEVADNLSLLGASTLTRKEKDTFIHVDDEFPTKLLGIEIEGACKQDGTPSPDNPVPIEVIEHPVVNVKGRNLADVSEAYYINSGGRKPEKIADGFRFTVTSDANRIINIPCELKKGDKIVVNFDEKKLSGTATHIPIYFNDLNMYLGKGRQYVMTGDVSYIGIYTETGTVGEFDVTNFRVTRNVDEGYKPYTSQSIAFTLPSEHPYLAKLPGGTADEIMVDREGNVELVARVGKLDTSNIQKPTRIGAVGNGLSRYEYTSFVIPPAAVASVAITPNFVPIIDFMFNSEGCYTSGRTLFVGTQSDPTEVIRASGYLYYELETPVVYTLGKIEMPKAQDSISNVWTDAEVTPMTGAEYVRDANIVVSNLEEAIASITQS